MTKACIAFWSGLERAYVHVGNDGAPDELGVELKRWYAEQRAAYPETLASPAEAALAFTGHWMALLDRYPGGSARRLERTEATEVWRDVPYRYTVFLGEPAVYCDSVSRYGDGNIAVRPARIPAARPAGATEAQEARAALAA